MTPLKAILLILICISAVVAINGCDEAKESYEPIKTQITSSSQDARFTLDRITIFKDELAYRERRAVYELKDSKTGKTYIGLSGVGIVEVASETCVSAKEGCVEREIER